MHSGAQTTELTWPKWNHSILSTLPMEQQQQILPGKSCFPSLLRSRTLQALQVFMLSAALPVLFLCNWCKTNCVYTVLNSWWCTFNKKNTANCSLWWGGSSCKRKWMVLFPLCACCSQSHPVRCLLSQLWHLRGVWEQMNQCSLHRMCTCGNFSCVRLHSFTNSHFH